MNVNEMIIEVIDKKYNSIRRNKKTKCIEFNNEKIKNYVYDDILSDVSKKYEGVKFIQKQIKNAVDKYADEHAYEPEEHKEGERSGWFAASGIKLNKNGKADATLANVIAFFENYPKYAGKLTSNEFTRQLCWDGNPITDAMEREWSVDVEATLGFNNENLIARGGKYVCDQNSFNPFKQAIESIPWDYEKRAETFFIKFLGVNDTPLNRSLTKKWLYAMMKRLYEPGCMFDNMLIIYDETQGTGKSKIVERLVECCGVPYGCDSTISLSTERDNIGKLNMAWICVVDELSNFIKSNAEEAKNFLAQRIDTTRLAYARNTEYYPRHCVFYGTTNLKHFLKDYTTSFERRYWIMEANGQRHSSQWWNENLPDEYCQQVLAEMKYMYDTDKEFNYAYLEPSEESELEQIQQEFRTMNIDPLLTDLRDLLNELMNVDNECDTFILEEGQLKKYWNRALDRRNGDKINSDDYVKTDNEFFGVNEDDNKKLQCKAIRTEAIRPFLEHNTSRKVISSQHLPQYFKRLGWSKKVKKLSGKTYNCYVKDENNDIL